MQPSVRDQILEIAESRVRIGGYDYFSFREIAKEIGIKSASVHYHFSTKADLGAAIAEKYRIDFLKKLGSPKALMDSHENPIKHYQQAFRNSLAQEKKMCLCGLLGAEIASLPPQVVDETKKFFEENMLWLTEAFQVAEDMSEVIAKKRALREIALLEGGMILARVFDEVSIFDDILA
ncbi:TetR/AcrR family transcriptional regulator [Pseudobacteriovorax antillogorgiicola]|uniref:Transcriptional regulator, TetR family n=1 Tax=Pseudobacteriovorax antillogorgiicola TaxID=1513793 RepID=A0A1Y6CXH7_9BACT|nr:TetR/AcrR family transcriptional regulator [Pseudobacteriovorax antillogorgiicola]TCS41797.1 TetR family transcriptional regulator [Pseudobacteriovorax antillogorgiicola]SMF83481.1 transcriptional regulator, TetR family [Pseudobacteriovorax antillogorgiicola]